MGLSVRTRLPFWRRTMARPVLYWIAGTILVWLLLPVDTFDLIIALEWYAPHSMCDRLGIPVFAAIGFMLPWAIISGIVVAILTFPATVGRRGGADIFQVRLGSAHACWFLTILIGVYFAFASYGVIDRLWDVLIPRTIESDCGGRADLRTFTMRKPAVQFSQLLYFVIGYWLLHLRAMALTTGPDEIKNLKQEFE